MIICNIFKQDQFLIIAIKGDATKADYILFDTLENVKNASSDLDAAHTQKIEGPFDIKTQEDLSYIYIPFEDIEVDLSAFTVLLRSFTSEDDEEQIPFFYVDDRELYYAEVSFLIWHCKTCIDKCNQDKLVAMILRKDMLNYALEFNLYEEAAEHYKDLARLLMLDNKTKCYKSSKPTNGPGMWIGGGCCKGGSCSIC